MSTTTTTGTSTINNLKRKASTADLVVDIKSSKRVALNYIKQEKTIVNIFNFLEYGFGKNFDKKYGKEYDIEMDFLIDLENVPSEDIFIAICDFINKNSSKVVIYKEYFCKITGFGNDPDYFFGILDQIRNNCKGVCKITLEQAKRVDMCLITAMYYSEVPYPMDYGDCFLQDFGSDKSYGKQSEKNGTIFAVKYPTNFDKQCQNKKPEFTVIKNEDIPSYTPFTNVVYLKQINRGLFTVYLQNIYKDEINKLN
jgi:hypothetical protein